MVWVCKSMEYTSSSCKFLSSLMIAFVVNKHKNKFLKRHVYSASRVHMSSSFATVLTFFISSVFHELVLFCLTRKVRGYGFCCQLLQLPSISSSVDDKKIKTTWLFSSYGIAKPSIHQTSESAAQLVFLDFDDIGIKYGQCVKSLT